MSEKLEKPLLVMVDHTGNDTEGYVLTPASANLLALARTLTDQPLHAIALNPSPDLAALAAQRVDVVLVPELGDNSPRVPAVVADAVLACANSVEFSALLCLSNYRGREVAARVGVQLGSGAAADATDLEVHGGELRAQRSILGATWTSVFQITRGTPVIAVRPSSGVAQPSLTPTNPTVVSIKVDYSPEALAVKVESSERLPETGRVGLAEADVVVCAGRGIEGDMSLVENLADRLGGAVGATRVVADEGWADRSLQIGQTGLSIAPRIYIGVGVSGAVHHTCGMQASQNVVAICDDPDAPIFEMCDLGIVGDINDVVPAALEELAKLEQQ